MKEKTEYLRETVFAETDFGKVTLCFTCLHIASVNPLTKINNQIHKLT